MQYFNVNSVNMIPSTISVKEDNVLTAVQRQVWPQLDTFSYTLENCEWQIKLAWLLRTYWISYSKLNLHVNVAFLFDFYRETVAKSGKSWMSYVNIACSTMADGTTFIRNFETVMYA